MSKESDLFVRNLKASLESWRMLPETESLYKSKLSKLNLPRAQWVAALDAIVEANTDGKLPPLALIYAELERQKRNAAHHPAMGWASFRWRGHGYSIRIRMAETWVIADLIWHDSHGVEHHKQEHVGEPVVNHIPKDATEFLIVPDEVVLDMRDIPSDRERNEIIQTIQRNLLKIAGGKVRIDRQPADETPVSGLREPVQDEETDEVPW